MTTDTTTDLSVEAMLLGGMFDNTQKKEIAEIIKNIIKKNLFICPLHGDSVDKGIF